MSTHHPSHRSIALAVALFVLLVVGSPAAVAQVACGVVVPSSPVTEVRENLGGFAAFGPFSVPAGATIHIKAVTRQRR